MSPSSAIVVGAGIVGAACAEALAEAGLHVTVLESSFPGAGATGASMGHVVVMDDSEAQVALTSFSRRLWEERAAALPPEAEDEACGTGTSAKMAVLAERGRLRPGQRWRQESLTGSLFEGWLEEREGALVPRVRGGAFVTGRATLLFDPRDPFRGGFTAIR